MNAKDVIIAPIVTEKSTKEATLGKFTFKVAKEADKKMIKKAIENAFKVNILHISTNIVKGRSVRTGARRIEFKKPAFKKAVAELKSGQTIPLFETGGQK